MYCTEMSLPRVSVRSGWGFVGVCGCVRPHWCCGPPPATSAAPALRRASRVRAMRLELEHQPPFIYPRPRTHALKLRRGRFIVFDGRESSRLDLATTLHHGHRFASLVRRLRAIWACGVPPKCGEFGCAAALGSLVQSHSMIAAANGDCHLASASARHYVFRLGPLFGLGADTFQSCIVRVCWP